MLTSLSLKKRLLCFSFLLVFAPALLLAQRTTVKGTVKDESKNTPLAGVSVMLKGSGNQGAVTDDKGVFSLSVSHPNDTLIFSNVGYATQEIPVHNRQVINVLLMLSSSSLEDVVVVGYGTQKRKDITGAVVSVDKQRLENLPNSNFAQALQGALPGVSINASGGGAEGNSVSILVRGRKSVLASNAPLIVMDGIPYNGYLSDINPSDIASLEVLKDASAAAIYGSRAANGVFLITTKRGVAGKPVISYDGYAGIQEVSNLPPVLQGEDFYNFKLTRLGIGGFRPSELENYGQKNFTNWLDLATRKGSRVQHTLTARGGGNNFKYYASLAYMDVKGIALNDDFKRVSSRVNLEANLTSWLTYGTNTQLTFNDRSGEEATFSSVYTMNPLATVYDSNGNPTIYPIREELGVSNPLAPTLANSLNNSYKFQTTNYLQVKVPFIKGLSYRFNTGADYLGRTTNTYWGRNTATGYEKKGSLSQGRSIERNLVLENIVNYDRSFDKHTIGFTGLYGYEYRNSSTTSVNAEDFPDDVLTFYQASVAGFTKSSTSFEKETLLSQMARLNYSYDSRYLLTLTARRDGYSGFSEDHKFAFFPVAAVGWNITNEKFLSNIRHLDNLKLRLSYGSVGNQAITPYQTLAKLGGRHYVDNDRTAAGYIPISLSNPNLKWETSSQFNAGIDFAILNNRISGAIDYYDTKTHDLLLKRAISPVHGMDEVTQNIGKTSNKGFEFAVNSMNIKKKHFTWSTNLNFSLNRNKWVDVYGDGKNDTASKYFIGYPVGADFGYVYDGVYQLTDDTLKTPLGKVGAGYAKIRDVNGDNVINESDRTILGKIEPDFVWGMANTFKYKNLSLYIFVHGVQGREEPNSLMSDNNVSSDVRYTTVVKNWWTPTNPTNDFYANRIGATSGKTVPIIQNSSFIRLKDVLLSYDFSGNLLEKVKLSKLRVYVEGRNLATITKWKGLDPEFSSQTTIPLQKEFLVGISISL